LTLFFLFNRLPLETRANLFIPADSGEVGNHNMADQANFEALMLGLMSENNESRKAAEAQFEALVNFPAQAAPLMCTAMAASQDHTVRSMTTIMFRKRATPEFYAALAPETQVSPPSSSSRANEIGLLCMALQIRLQALRC